MEILSDQNVRVIIYSIVISIIIQIIKKFAPVLETNKIVVRCVSIGIIALATGLDMWLAGTAIELQPFIANVAKIAVVAEGSYQWIIKFLTAKQPTNKGDK